MEHRSADRVPIKHRVKIENAENICERDGQGARYFFRDLFVDPAIELLRGLQGRNQGAAALGRQAFENRMQGMNVAVTHDGLPARSDRLLRDRKSTRLNSSHPSISYAVFCLKKKKKQKL